MLSDAILKPLCLLMEGYCAWFGANSELKLSLVSASSQVEGSQWFFKLSIKIFASAIVPFLLRCSPLALRCV